jgi:hypothetical protein
MAVEKHRARMVRDKDRPKEPGFRVFLSNGLNDFFHQKKTGKVVSRVDLMGDDTKASGVSSPSHSISHLLDDGMRQAEGTGNHHTSSTVDNMLDAVEGHGPGHASDPEVSHKVERQSISSHAPGGLLDDGVRQTEGTDDRFSTVDNMLRAVEGDLCDDGVQTEGTDDRFSTVDNMLRAVEGPGPGHASDPKVERQSTSSHSPGGLLDCDVRPTEGTEDHRSTVDAVLPAVEGQGPEKKKKRRKKKKSVKPEPEAVAPALSPSTRHASDLKAEHHAPIVQQADLY